MTINGRPTNLTYNNARTSQNNLIKNADLRQKMHCEHLPQGFQNHTNCHKTQFFDKLKVFIQNYIIEDMNSILLKFSYFHANSLTGISTLYKTPVQHKLF